MVHVHTAASEAIKLHNMLIATFHSVQLPTWQNTEDTFNTTTLVCKTQHTDIHACTYIHNFLHSLGQNNESDSHLSEESGILIC